MTQHTTIVSSYSLTIVCFSAALLLAGAASALAQDVGIAALPEVQAGTYRAEVGIPYVPSPDAYQREQCSLSLYLPTHQATFPTVVWFHGGGLTSGSAHVPDGLREQGIGVAAVNYRLSPRASVDEIVDDAAAAVAWVRQHVAEYGGDPASVFVAGHSAGGYLASMVVLDSMRLAGFGESLHDLAGAIPLSGHTVTHFTERAARGIAGTQVVADSLAPIFHVRSRSVPIRLITGDRDLELLGRYEENAFFWRMMQVVGNGDCELMELEGYGHGIVEPAMPLLVQFVREHHTSE